MADKVYAFVDNSNVWIEGKKVAGRKARPPVPSNYRYRVEYGKLLEHILDGRELAAVPKLYGSEPPPNDSLWNLIRAKGYDVTVFKRNIFKKEKGLDMRMGLDIGRLVIKERPVGTVVMVAGDADYVQVAIDAHTEGWKIESWYWSNAARTLKTAVDRFESLNPFLYTIGFDSRR